MPDQPTNTDAAPLSPALRDVPWRWSDVLLGLSVPLVFWAVDLVAGRSLLPGLPRWAAWVYQLVPTAWMILFPLWAARRRLPAWRPRLPGAWPTAHEAIRALPVTVVLYLAILAVRSVLEFLFGHEAAAAPNVSEGAIQTMGSPAELVLLFVLFAGVGPLAEELTFRGLFFNALRRRLPIAPALIVQAVVFGMMHHYSPAYMLIAAVIGLILGLDYLWRKTLLAPLFAHVTINFSTTALTLVALALTPELGVTVKPDAGGLRVESVAPGSAADQAGLRPGDVITAVDHDPVTTADELRAALARRKLGVEVEVSYRRDGEARTTRAVPQARGLKFGR